MTFRVYLLLTAILTLSFFSASAQDGGFEDPVSWTLDHTKVSESEYVLQFNAEVEKGWYIYSQHIGDAGPVPTSFTFTDDKGTAYTLVGKTEEISDHAKDSFDPIWSAQIKKFSTLVSFQQKVKYLDQSKPITGYLEFMTCDDQKCLPPVYIDFEFAVVKPGTVRVRKEGGALLEILNEG